MNSPQQIAEAFAAVREQIRVAGGVDVALVAVTKGFGIDAIDAAVRNGADAVGENYVQELLSKLESSDQLGISGTAPIYFIGQLQTNKVKYLVGRVERYCSVDRVSLVREIAKRDPGAEVLIQVASDDDVGRGGCPLEKAPAMVETASAAGLRVAGLMTVGPAVGGPEAARPGFARVRRLVDQLGLDVCSMGMSNDVVVAVEEGSTEVRVGSALFGERRNRAR